MTMDQSPQQDGVEPEDLLRQYPPEKVDAALARMAELGLLEHLHPDLTEAYREARVDLRDDGVVHAILLTLRIVEEEVARLTGAYGGDVAGWLLRTTTRTLTDQACATVKASVVRHGHWRAHTATA